MAGFLSKHDELLRLIPDLQCHDCKNVPGPTLKDRYSCTKAAHTLCEEHKTKCPCGSNVVESASPIIAKLLQNLPWMCQNYKTGCRESKMNVEDLEYHQRNCIFRQVFCPSMQWKCKEDKILMEDIFDHLKICQKGLEEEEMSNGEANKFLVTFGTKMYGLKDEKCWSPSKMTSACGAVFFTNGYIENKTIYLWIRLLGSSDEAKKFSCAFSITNKIGEKFNYSGPVHTLDTQSKDVIASGSLFIMKVNAAKRSLNERKQLAVDFTIRNLKEEVKDNDIESGVSEGE